MKKWFSSSEPKTFRHVVLVGVGHGREVAGHGLDRLRFLDLGQFVQLHRQHRHDLERAEHIDAVDHLGHERVRHVGRGEGELRVAGAELDVGDHAKEAPLAPLHHHVAPDGHILHRNARV